jgi:putative NIF3 family GTP cyclohydrolase 1 type 2
MKHQETDRSISQFSNPMPTIQSIIHTILTAIPGSITTDTVDTVKTGDASHEATGIVTTFLASQSVLQKAVALGANFIITHEPTFYNHLDRTDWLENDPVYQAKRQYIDDHGLVVWRFHDNWHTHRPDGILLGVMRQLAWEAYADPDNPLLFHLPPTTLGSLAQTLKAGLGIATLRMVGDPSMPCQSVGFLMGAWGGENHIRYAGECNPDVLVVGETPEWETSEYIRDAVIQGRARGLIVTGHAASEEPGMAYLVEWLRPKFPGLPIQHVPVGDAFAFV